MTPKMKKRYKLPKGCSIESFTMRELDGTDELEAAMWAEKKVTSATEGNPMALMQLEQKEAMRLALCEVDGKPVNVEGIPFTEMDGFSIKTMRYIQFAFNDLNGISEEDLKNFKAGAELLVEAPASEDEKSE